MRKILSALLLLTLPATRALAGPGCQTTTGGTGIVLEKIRQNATGPELFGCINRSFDIIASSGVPTNSTGSWIREGRVDVSTLGALGNGPAIYVSSGMRVGAGAGLSVDFGLVGGTGTFTAVGNTSYGLTVSSGLAVTSGTVVVGGPGGLDASGTGIKASTGSFTASGNTQYSLYTSSGIKMGAGTLSAQGPIQGTATGNAIFSLTTSSGITVQAGTLKVAETVEANKFKGDGSQLTGVGGGGTVQQQGNPQAGQIAVFQAGTVLSSGPISIALGTNGVSTTTFSGVVRLTTGSLVNFAPAAYTTTQTSFLAAVTGSTISFVVQGSTVNCRTTGGMQVSAAGQTLSATVMVDGSFTGPNTIPGTSASVGVNACMAGASGSFGCSAPIDIDFQVTPGVSHTFALVLKTNGGTLTWPGTIGATSGTIGQFKCREVPSL